MSKISIYFGGLLSLTGIIAFVVTGFEHPTSLIPLFVGAPIAICGALTLRDPAKAKIYMHIALTLALLGFIASAWKVSTLEEFGSVKSVSLWTMCVLCFILLGAYVQSFIKARTNKEG